ncbi:EamA family transporter [Caulobacter sp. S45]|uniref:EamA family transporter n=1 Tax=Caulobacter sp. S45 TaxID=1641861 RepID=UPI001576EE18|nr:EamA family transporter [Caulobacter sp. S45]
MSVLSLARTRLGASPWLPVATLAAAMLSFQYGAATAEGLFPSVGAQGATALRISLAALMLAPIMRPWRIRVTRKTLPPLLAYGASLGGMNLLFYMALRTTPLGVAVALEFVGPLGVAVATSRRWHDFACVGLALAGLLLLLPIGREVAAVDATGALFALGAGGCWALYIVFGQMAGHEHGPAAAAFGMAVATLIALPVGLLHAGLHLFAPALIPTALLVAVFSSALPYSLEMVSLTRLPARTYGVLTSMEPASGALMGLVLLHERLSVRQLVAILAVMLASVWATLSVRRRLVPPE